MPFYTREEAYADKAFEARNTPPGDPQAVYDDICELKYALEPILRYQDATCTRLRAMKPELQLTRDLVDDLLGEIEYLTEIVTEGLTRLREQGIELEREW